MGQVKIAADDILIFYFYILKKYKRGAMVEWLEQLGYSAESHRKMGDQSLALPCGDWKTLSVIPAVNGYLFQIWEG